ncbi:uncharacterized protein LOC110703001 [Chenopodium quinoa]|uniref:uncharacterized protein LOC110703001 n=1 Tax=Chenopodium quinoa TaxID=63459 RepID=UPI000B77B565|nr:uncharacterized protein LOC110703001 [Chenopodium quinoa]
MTKEISIGYSKAWLARARAKFMIYGSSVEQYARVWDYAKAIIKYNRGSGCCVVVDGIKQPEPPLFMRLYVCLAPLKNGFLKGGSDPKAEKRFCVRHIWTNFKLQFSGATFKELFWNAARATIMFDFEVSMESCKFLSKDAYEYLANIPKQYWSRHAFSPNCKSNMLPLNNVYETFNAIIKDARDKPILTQMEWMRRYMMKRNSKKWEAVLKMEGKLMPYVTKVFEGLEKAARYCIVQVSRGELYEVELNADQVLVDLEQRTCRCYHWQLTGIPCVHAYACMLDKRVDPEDYVDFAYSRDTYMLAYEDAIELMPSPKH